MDKEKKINAIFSAIWRLAIGVLLIISVFVWKDLLLVLWFGFMGVCYEGQLINQNLREKS